MPNLQSILCKVREYSKSSTDNFLPPIPISDWLIFCCRNLILHEKKNWKWQKHKSYDKNKRKMPKKNEYENKLWHFLLWNRPTERWFNMLRDGKNIIDQKLYLKIAPENHFRFRWNYLILKFVSHFLSEITYAALKIFSSFRFYAVYRDANFLKSNVS